jgi:hypothetical protein
LASRDPVNLPFTIFWLNRNLSTIGTTFGIHSTQDIRITHEIAVTAVAMPVAPRDTPLPTSNWFWRVLAMPDAASVNEPAE